MQYLNENITTYLLYTLAIINILLFIRNFELNCRFNTYIKEITKTKKEKFNLIILFLALIIITIPIKLQTYKENNLTLFIVYIQQIVMLINGIRLNKSTTKLICTTACLKFIEAFDEFQDECLKNNIKEIDSKTLIEHMPLPPWKTESTTILALQPLLNKLYLKKLKTQLIPSERAEELIQYIAQELKK